MLEGLIYGTNHSLKWDREYFIEYITEQGFVRTDKTRMRELRDCQRAYFNHAGGTFRSKEILGY